MADPFIGEIRLWALKYAPWGWAFCNGQVIPIRQNTALFAVLGNTYGGDGQNDFALPDLQGRVPMHPGTGPGLTPRSIGQTGGNPATTLTADQLPSHTHVVGAYNGGGNKGEPTNNVWAVEGRGKPPAYSTSAPDKPMSPQALPAAGGGQAHENRQPYLALNFCIAMVGIFPSRG